jgi:hypothetical protein
VHSKCRTKSKTSKKKPKKRSPKQLTSTTRETMNYNHGLALLRVIRTGKQKYVEYREKMEIHMRDFQAKERTLPEGLVLGDK